MLGVLAREPWQLLPERLRVGRELSGQRPDRADRPLLALRVDLERPGLRSQPVPESILQGPGCQVLDERPRAPQGRCHTVERVRLSLLAKALRYQFQAGHGAGTRASRSGFSPHALESAERLAAEGVESVRQEGEANESAHDFFQRRGGLIPHRGVGIGDEPIENREDPLAVAAHLLPGSGTGRSLRDHGALRVM